MVSIKLCRFLIGLALVGSALSTSHPVAAKSRAEDRLIPRDVFFGNPDRTNVQISPDGKWLSYLAPNLGVLNVWVQLIGEQEARVVTTASQRPIRTYFWSYNSHQIIYSQDRAGDENFHLYAVNLDDGKEIDLTPFEAVQAQLIASDQSFPDEVLVGVNNRDPQVHDVWRINTITGQGQMTFQNDAGYASLGADSKFQVRLATRVSATTGGSLAYMRDDDKGDWYELASWTLEDADASGPIRFSRDGATLYMTDARGKNTGRLYAYTSLPDGEATYEPIAADERADADDVIFDPNTGKPQAVSFEYARREWRNLDQSITADWTYLQNLAEGDMKVVSRNLADDHWIVSYLRDDGPVSYFLYDRSAHHAQFMFSDRIQLQGVKLAHMKPVTIKSRDGLDLISYLTLPSSGPQKHLPMVLLVHGGPWARDSWGYNAIHQWLANRGYAVLSVNYRGSTGLGKAFLNAGNHQWAGKMHNDLIDAVNWAVQQKYADPDRVAIMGGSYGGYATLVGMTFTPDFFAAGVDIVGPSHVRTLLETIPAYWAPIRGIFEQRVGSLSDPNYLDEISPLTRVDAIRKPLLIGQGQNDPRVKEAESRQIVSAMQAKNLPVTYVMFPDEGHGFARPENRLGFFAITEAFLAKHLGGKYEPIGSSVRSSTAQIEAGADLIPGLGEDAQK